MPAGATEPVIVPYIEHVPPDTTAQIFWLKNRRPEDWRDRKDVDHTGKFEINQTTRHVIDPRNLDDDQRDVLRGILLARIEGEQP